MSNNLSIKGVLYQSKSAKKMTNAVTPRGRDPSNGYSPSHNRSIQNLQNLQNIQSDNSKWAQNSTGLALHHQNSLPIQNSQQQLALSTSTSFNQEYNQPQMQSQQQQNQYYQQQQQISARQHVNQAQYINSIINRSRSPLNKSQSSQQQQAVSPISKSSNKYNMAQITQLITPSKQQRLPTEQSNSSQSASNNQAIQSASNPRYHATKSPRTINHQINPNNLSATLQSGFGISGNNSNSNSQNNNSLSIYNMVLNDENPQTLRKVNQQSHSYHNLQQYLQVNSNNSNSNLNNANNSSNIINNTNSVLINNNNNSYSNFNNNSTANLNNNSNQPLPQQNLNNSSYLIQSQQNQEMRASSSSRIPSNGQGGEFSTKNISQIPAPTSSSNRPDSNNNRPSNILRITPVAKQSSTNSNNVNNNSVQKTNYTLYSNCTNCTELEKELELLKSIIKQCSKCQHSYLSNGSSNSHHNQNNNAADSEKMAMLDPENNTLENNNINGNNQYMMEKIQNIRLQEQIQQLMRQLDQAVIERDQLKYGHFNQSQEIMEKLQKYEAQIKLLQTNHAKTEQKLGNYTLLKNKLQDFINSCVNVQTQSSGKAQLNTQELLQECLFIKDYISQQQNQINTLNQRQLVIAKPSLQNNSSLYNNQNNNNGGGFSQDKNSNLGELVNQQLVLEERESLQNQYQALPSAIKALEIVHKMKNIQQQNPFLPNQSQA